MHWGWLLFLPCFLSLLIPLCVYTCSYIHRIRHCLQHSCLCMKMVLFSVMTWSSCKIDTIWISEKKFKIFPNVMPCLILTGHVWKICDYFSLIWKVSCKSGSGILLVELLLVDSVVSCLKTNFYFLNVPSSFPHPCSIFVLATWI